MAVTAMGKKSMLFAAVLFLFLIFIPTGPTLTGTNQQFLTLERPFKCTFLCCARPEIFIRGMDGKIKQNILTRE